MDQDQRLLVVGIYINSALYLIGVFVAGLVTDHPTAWRMALVTAGVCYFAYFAQVWGKRHAATAATLVSVAAGIVAGLALLT